MLKVVGLTSARTGVAPQYRTTLAVATHVNAGTMTSSPGPIPNAARTKWRPVVQLVVASACLALCLAANCLSNSATLGPCVSQPVAKGSRTAFHSSSPVLGSEIWIFRSVTQYRPLLFRRHSMRLSRPVSRSSSYMNPRSLAALSGEPIRFWTRRRASSSLYGL